MALEKNPSDACKIVHYLFYLHNLFQTGRIRNRIVTHVVLVQALTFHYHKVATKDNLLQDERKMPSNHRKIPHTEIEFKSKKNWGEKLARKLSYIYFIYTQLCKTTILKSKKKVECDNKMANKGLLTHVIQETKTSLQLHSMNLIRIVIIYHNCINKAHTKS